MSELIYRQRTGGEIKQHGLKTAAGSPIRTAQYDRYFFSPCARISLTQASSFSVTGILANLYVNNESGIQQPPHPQSSYPSGCSYSNTAFSPFHFQASPTLAEGQFPSQCLAYTISTPVRRPLGLGTPSVRPPLSGGALHPPSPAALPPTAALDFSSAPPTTAGTGSPGIFQQTLPNASLHIHFAIISGSPQGVC